MKRILQASDGDGSPARAVIQTYARAAGALFLISFAAGAFGEVYVPSKLIVSGDAAATAENLRNFDSLFRLGFAAYLVEAVCDAALAMVFYILLKPVSRGLALLAACFGLLATATFATAELFYFAGPQLLLGGADYLKVFSPQQLDALAMLSIKLFGYGHAMFTVFYGLAWIVRGSLIAFSGYLPKLLGLLMMLGGLGFAVRNFALILAPDSPFASGRLLMLIAPGALLLALWLLVKGVNVSRWEARAAARP